MTSRRRKVSIDDPGFNGYVGGGRHLLVQPPPPLGSAMRAMFEFMPADEDCPPQCYKCKQPRQPRRQRREGGER